jgi:hypothetical protein
MNEEIDGIDRLTFAGRRTQDARFEHDPADDLPFSVNTLDQRVGECHPGGIAEKLPTEMGRICNGRIRPVLRDRESRECCCEVVVDNRTGNLHSR